MGKNSAIEWTDHTFNPWWGCVTVSEACRNCYAETLAKRTGHNVWGAEAERRALSDNNWRKPLNWDRSARERGVVERVFCASMADVFEDRRDLDGHRERLWALIRETTNLRWLLLTKRPQNIAGMLPSDLVGDDRIWLGTTAEDQATADERIPHLLKVPAAVRFLSCEPLLGPIDLDRARCEIHDRDYVSDDGMWCNECSADAGDEPGGELEHGHWLGDLEYGISWVIAGGESGPGSRPMHPLWVRDIRDQCNESGVPFLFKQWGAWAPAADVDIMHPLMGRGTWREGVHDFGPYQGGTGIMLRVGKKTAGRELDGRTWDQFPEARNG